MTLLSSQFPSSKDKQISKRQFQDIVRLSKQQRIGPQITTDEIQVEPKSGPNGGIVRFKSIPILYKTLEPDEEDADFDHAKVVTLNGTLIGAEQEFPKLT